jgi:excisionase family DNA binding protein
MKTYDFKEAAEFLKTSESTLDELLRSGEILAAKHGQSWCFLEDDLVAYHRRQSFRQMEEMKTLGRVNTSLSQVKATQPRRRTRNNKPNLADYSVE